MGHCFAGFSGQRRRSLFRANTCHVAHAGETRNALACFSDFVVHQQYYRSGFRTAHDRRFERLFFSRLRRARLPYAMVTSALLAIWASFHLWLAAGTLRADIENMDGRLHNTVSNLNMRNVQSPVLPSLLRF